VVGHADIFTKLKQMTVFERCEAAERAQARATPEKLENAGE
jgi:hypothetical protein